MNNIFPTKRPYIDKEGNIFVPDNTNFGGQLIPKLTSREWLVLFYLNIDLSACKNKKLKKDLKKFWTGSNATLWRTRKSLRKKNYII